jgi:hypothetical protein
MKTTNCKSEQARQIKRLSQYFCVIIAFCFFNLGALRAEEPTKGTSDNIQKEQSTETLGDKSELNYINLQDKLHAQTQMVVLWSNVMKIIRETQNAIVRNMK